MCIVYNIIGLIVLVVVVINPTESPSMHNALRTLPSAPEQAEPGTSSLRLRNDMASAKRHESHRDAVYM